MRSPEIVEMDSGIEVTFNPVTPRLYRMLMDQYESGHPRPIAPTIVVHYQGDEDEEMLDLTDPDYQQRLAVWRDGCNAFLVKYFVKNHIAVDIPKSWSGDALREVGIDIPRPATRFSRLLFRIPMIGKRLRRRRADLDAERRMYFLDTVAIQTTGDAQRFNEAILASAGLYSERMVREEQERFRPDDRRPVAQQMGHKEQRGTTIIDLRRSPSSTDVGVQPEGLGGGPERVRQGESGGAVPLIN